MKRIVLILSMMWSVAYGQKVIGEAGNRYTRDSFSVVGNRNIAMWGNSLTAAGRIELKLMQLSGRYVHNGGVSGETSTSIKNRMIADSVKYGWNTIIWAGRNNFANKATVLADVAAMVAALGHQRYYVFSVTNSRSEPSGSANYIAIASLNADLASTYGAHYVDVRSFLVSQYNPGIPQDVTDFGNDVPPSSLMQDVVHPNYSGDTLIANWIYANKFSLFNNTNTGLVQSSGLAKTDINNLLMQNIYMIKKQSLDYFMTWAGEVNGSGSPKFARVDWAANKFFAGYLAGVNGNGVRATGNNLYLMGETTGGNLSSGADNTGIGGFNFVNATTASNMVALGLSALELTTGGGNVGIGPYAGRFNTTGTNNIWLGYNAGNGSPQANNLSNSMALGVSSTTTRSNQIVLGNSSHVETQLRQGVVVNTSNDLSAPKTNVSFQINSLTKGFMPPRMTAAQRLAISVGSGDSSLIVFDKDSARLMEYSGSAWRGVRYTNESALSSSGRYTPTITAGTNVASVGTVYNAHYTQVGNEVTVAGVVLVNATLSATTSQVTISLPGGWLYSNSYGDLDGSAAINELNTRGAGFITNNSTSTALLTFTSLAIGQNDIHYRFTFTKTN